MIQAKWVHRIGVILATAFIYGAGGTTIFANPPICDEVCSSSTSCTDTCYVNMMEFENGNDITCFDYGTFDRNTCCGDGFCATDYENDGSCAADCDLGLSSEPTCGNSTCEVGESHRNCPADCPRYNDCGDGICDGPDGMGGGETTSNCPNDCLFSDFCNGGSFTCPGWQTCRGNRCTYDPAANVCADSYDCGVGQKCIGFSASSSTPGLCVAMF